MVLVALRHPRTLVRVLCSLPAIAISSALDGAAAVAQSRRASALVAVSFFAIVFAASGLAGHRFADLMAEASYWMLLGILSSVGLGSGLHVRARSAATLARAPLSQANHFSSLRNRHSNRASASFKIAQTFVLFLGPHVVRVATTAAARGRVDFSARIERYFDFSAVGAATPAMSQVGSWDLIAALSAALSPAYAANAWGSGDSAVFSNFGGSAAAGGFSLVLAVAAKVAWPAFLWGVGTALGELPPYFIARAARLSGKALEELADVAVLRERRRVAAVVAAKLVAARARGGGTGSPASTAGSPASLRARLVAQLRVAVASPAQAAADAAAAPGAAAAGLLDRGKLLVFESVRRYGFWAILAAASVPNPLFDLAGITCGHFGVAFGEFFVATLLGKAVIKVSIQVCFVILMTHYGVGALSAVRAAFPAWPPLARAFDALERAAQAGQHATCSRSATTAACALCCSDTFSGSSLEACVSACGGADAAAGGSGSSWLAHAWGLVMLSMFAYFLLSILDALVQQRLADEALAAAAASAATPSPAAQRAQHLALLAELQVATPPRVSSVSGAGAGGENASEEEPAMPRRKLRMPSPGAASPQRRSSSSLATRLSPSRASRRK